MERSYLIRYGMMGQVGRFAADPGTGYERGQTVVVRSHRGAELGEVLIEAPARAGDDVPPAGTALILRAAGLEDLE
ncbi:MAG: signal peptidase, partial [Planctomycetia bacterium]|nr:signal peptidase [Planctomycetia bacterium]